MKPLEAGNLAVTTMSYTERPLNLGLCCLNTTLRDSKPRVFASRTIRVAGLNQQNGYVTLQERVRNNLADLITMMHWNVMNDIRVFRLSSDIFPHMSNPIVPFYGFDQFQDQLTEIGELANQMGQRLTFHPGQFNVLGTPHEHTLEKTLLELDRHAEILDRLDQGPDSIMVIHGGGYYGDKPLAMLRWAENFGFLSWRAATRLVLENCERCYSVRQCLDISQVVYEMYGIYVPVVVDTHHYHCYSKIHPNETQEPLEDMLPEVVNTWTSRGIRMKCHISEQGSGRVGHHSDYIDVIPQYLLDIPERFGISIDIMVEAKKKELAIEQLHHKYQKYLLPE